MKQSHNYIFTEGAMRPKDFSFNFELDFPAASDLESVVGLLQSQKCTLQLVSSGNELSSNVLLASYTTDGADFVFDAHNFNGSLTYFERDVLLTPQSGLLISSVPCISYSIETSVFDLQQPVLGTETVSFPRIPSFKKSKVKLPKSLTNPPVYKNKKKKKKRTRPVTERARDSRRIQRGKVTEHIDTAHNVLNNVHNYLGSFAVNNPQRRMFKVEKTPLTPQKFCKRRQCRVCNQTSPMKQYKGRLVNTKQRATELAEAFEHARRMRWKETKDFLDTYERAADKTLSPLETYASKHRRLTSYVQLL
ncbi:hypothetical protein PCE1_002906 [Barthelona sp. PCE]